MNERIIVANQANPSVPVNMSDPSPVRCRAVKSNGEPCKLPPMLGSTVCGSHGGRAPQVKAAAARRLAEARVTSAATLLGLPIAIEPRAALLEEVHRAAGAVNWLGDKLRELGDDESLKQRDLTSRFEKPSVWLEMYWAERDRLVRVSKACLDVGIAEREVAVAERYGAQLAEIVRDLVSQALELAVKAGLAAGEATRIQREDMPAVFRARLSLAAGATA